MTFLSPLDDFLRRTLYPIAGTLEKLRFVSELREEDGRYHHWGLERVYGERNAHQAMSGAHTQLFLRVLETRVQDLFAEANENAPDGNLYKYVSDLQNRGQGLLPTELGGGLADHLNYTLETLSRLARHLDRTSRPGASQLRRLAR